MTAADRHTVAVDGNPNCGKTTLFNLLTGVTQKVGNWPGVTVEKKVGAYAFHGRTYDLVDLPGVYMIGAVGRGSEDERVARDDVLSGEAEVVIDIVDAANLELNLYLTAQLCELGGPIVVVVDMVDVAERAGVAIDAAALSRELGCPGGSGRRQPGDRHAGAEGRRRRGGLDGARRDCRRNTPPPSARRSPISPRSWRTKPHAPASPPTGRH